MFPNLSAIYNSLCSLSLPSTVLLSVMSSPALFLFPYLLFPSSSITASLLEQMSLCLFPYPLHCHYVPVLTDLLLCVKIGLLVFTWPLSEIPEIPHSFGSKAKPPQHPPVLSMCELLQERAAGWGGGMQPHPSSAQRRIFLALDPEERNKR